MVCNSGKILSEKETRFLNKFPNWILLAMGLIPWTVILLWGELSEFNVNLWILPIINVSSNYILFEQFLLGAYYLVSPILILSFLRSSTFRRENERFLALILVTIFSYALLRYAEFIYDTRGPSAFNPFGNFFPAAFWSLPLISTAAASLILSART
jgi:hypothetical protein